MIVTIIVLAALLVSGAILAVTRPWSPAANTTDTTAGGSSPAAAPSAVGGGASAAGEPANGAQQPAGFPAIWAGTWTGTYQQDNGKTFQIRLDITAGTKTAQVRYPDIGCQGTVTLLSQGAGVVRAQEAITAGRCTPTGTMTIHQGPDGRLEVAYRPDVAPYTANATLTRG